MLLKTYKPEDYKKKIKAIYLKDVLFFFPQEKKVSSLFIANAMPFCLFS